MPGTLLGLDLALARSSGDADGLSVARPLVLCEVMHEGARSLSWLLFALVLARHPLAAAVRCAACARASAVAWVAARPPCRW